MDSKAFFARFTDLHTKFSRGALPAHQREEYNFYCASLTHMLVSAQRMSTTRLTQRGDLRMAEVVRAEIELTPGQRERTSTVDLGQTGFAAVVGTAPDVPMIVPFVLHLARGPIGGTATVISTRPHRGAHRIALEFHDLSQSARDALQIALIDSVLARLRTFMS